MSILNKKGAVATALSFLLKLILFLVITGSAVYIFNNVAFAEIRAQNAVRDLGVAFDSLSLSAREASLSMDCPTEVEFTIERAGITARVSSAIGMGFASYSYMHEANAILPSKKVISCGASKKIEVSKKYDSSLRPVIAVR